MPEASGAVRSTLVRDTDRPDRDEMPKRQFSGNAAETHTLHCHVCTSVVCPFIAAAAAANNIAKGAHPSTCVSRLNKSQKCVLIQDGGWWMSHGANVGNVMRRTLEGQGAGVRVGPTSTPPPGHSEPPTSCSSARARAHRNPFPHSPTHAPRFVTVAWSSPPFLLESVR